MFSGTPEGFRLNTATIWNGLRLVGRSLVGVGVEAKGSRCQVGAQVRNRGNSVVGNRLAVTRISGLTFDRGVSVVPRG